MYSRVIPLNMLPLGDTARVISLDAEGRTRRRMLDLGLIDNTEVKALQRSPSGDPVAYMIRGAVIALRSEESSKIMVCSHDRGGFQDGTFSPLNRNRGA